MSYFLLNTLITLLGGFLINQSLIQTNHTWAKSLYSQISSVMLPFITFAITNAISGNLALSLGMVGALSIVRFRNPVKNPFELVIYFALISLGICVKVETKLGIYFLIVVIFIIISYGMLNFFSKKFNFNLFSIPFDEGYGSNIMEVVSKSEIENDQFQKLVISFYYDRNEGIYFYKLAADRDEKLKKIKDDIISNAEVNSIDIKYNL